MVHGVEELKVFHAQGDADALLKGLMERQLYSMEEIEDLMK